MDWLAALASWLIAFSESLLHEYTRHEFQDSCLVARLRQAKLLKIKIRQIVFASDPIAGSSQFRNFFLGKVRHGNSLHTPAELTTESTAFRANINIEITEQIAWSFLGAGKADFVARLCKIGFYLLL